MLADKLSAMWGQQVFIENKPATTSAPNTWQGPMPTDIPLFDPGAIRLAQAEERRWK
jgi:hypothetical protein